MTQQELDELRSMTHASVQDENGIDVTQIDHLLSLSPTDRLILLEEFIKSMVFLEHVREKNDARIATARVAGKAPQ